MRGLTRDWMEAGAVGLNTGPRLPARGQLRRPTSWSSWPGSSREYGGIYAAHIRYHGRRASPTPTASRSRSAARRASRSGSRTRSVDDETEPLLEEARQAGRRLRHRLVPLSRPARATCWCWLPPEDQIGGFDAVIERLRDDPAHRRRIATRIEEHIGATHAGGGREYFSDTQTGRHIGRSIAEVAAERGTPLGETAVDLIIEESPDALLVFRRGMTEEAFEALARRTLAHPAFMVVERRHLPRRAAAPARLRLLRAGSSARSCASSASSASRRRSAG